jgi:hypothetical protein
MGFECGRTSKYRRISLLGTNSNCIDKRILYPDFRSA